MGLYSEPGGRLRDDRSSIIIFAPAIVWRLPARICESIPCGGVGPIDGLGPRWKPGLSGIWARYHGGGRDPPGCAASQTSPAKSLQFQKRRVPFRHHERD